jgi:hypothetical protein
MKITDRARRASEVCIRIDQGDYLQERGGYDWGRTDHGGATTYGSVAEAEGAVARLSAESIAREIEPAQNC